MQVNPQEVSAEKATTPAANLRLVSVEQLQKIHRELDACQKVIWLAGCRPRVPNGFDPAYVTGAQEQLKLIEGLIAQPSGWTKDKPTAPGAYWVRGFRLGEPDSRPALVEVTRSDAGTLLCNLNDSNTNDETREWSFVEDLAERFEWFGPLGTSGTAKKSPSVPISIVQIEEQMPEKFGECAAIWHSGGNYWTAALYIWDAAFNDSTAVARWFHNLGAVGVSISHTLYDTHNGVRDGEVPEGGARQWFVEFSAPEVPHA